MLYKWSEMNEYNRWRQRWEHNDNDYNDEDENEQAVKTESKK